MLRWLMISFLFSFSNRGQGKNEKNRINSRSNYDSKWWFCFENTCSFTEHFEIMSNNRKFFIVLLVGWARKISAKRSKNARSLQTITVCNGKPVWHSSMSQLHKNIERIELQTAAGESKCWTIETAIEAIAEHKKRRENRLMKMNYRKTPRTETKKLESNGAKKQMKKKPDIFLVSLLSLWNQNAFAFIAHFESIEVN